MRRRLIAGNWKLHKTRAEAVELAQAVAEGMKELPDVDGLVAPVSLSLAAVAEAASGSRLQVAGQHAHSENKGAFTGELSPALLKDAGASHCIVGHSERRSLFGETSEHTQAKVKALLDAGLTPILCVGERLDEREADKTLDVVLEQLRVGLAKADGREVIVAYEPVWAIGTGKTATPADAQAVHAAIRTALGELKAGAPDAVRVLYGGSVKPANAADLLAQPDIDGALVGGASLDAESFLAIMRA
ncbi:MAG: triose-phosphate isomerase [Myxococcota bacterium]